MTPPEIKERAFEDAVECALLRGGPDECAGAGAVREPPPQYGEFPSGGFVKRSPTSYDKDLALFPKDVLDFIQATQPKEWEKYTQHHAADASKSLMTRISKEIASRGLLDVLRKGIKDTGCGFKLAYFRPASGLNPDTARLHEANSFAVVRQVKFSSKTEQSVDLVLTLNGLPLFTAELKNPLNGQDVQDAIKQYCRDRDPREPLSQPGQCLAHFAVDPHLVYVASQLAGARTVFLPFNRGWNRGAGNPPVPPTRKGYATDYLWTEVWARDSLLDLIRNFIVEIELDQDKGGRSRAKTAMIFPRYHQIQAVRNLVVDARANGPGQRYLIEHSAGSGKSFTLGWLAHRLATLHDVKDERVFDSIIVITDRRILNRQLQKTMLQLEQTPGVVENIEGTSQDLKAALESGKTIIVTTLQKFPVIADEVTKLAGHRFAVIIDEAHSSQSGESRRSVNKTLSVGSLEEAEEGELGAPTPDEELEELLAKSMAERGSLPNVSLFAFTATPKPKTLELFGTKLPDGKFGPFHLYSMRQAIEEGFILDVLASYATYDDYWRLLKKIEDDPKFEKRKATALLKAFVSLHDHAINEKVAIMVEHFATQVQDKINGQAKAMIVTRSRLHAVRYKLALDKYLQARGYPFKTLVAFSDTIVDGGKSYTESGMNGGISEAQTATTFARTEYRFLVVANKFQTGFDQPLLYAMYVDKKLGGVNAVQTLSRLNRIHPEKDGTAVLDFANTADEIKKAFEPYYEATLLSQGTDPNLLYTLQGQLLTFGVYADAEVTEFARLWHTKGTTQDQLYSALAPYVKRFSELLDDERKEFRGQLTDYVRQYAFLAQVIPFTDGDLEKLYLFAKYLRKLLPVERERLPIEVQQAIDMESFRLQQTFEGSIALERNQGVIDPMQVPESQVPPEEDVEALSRIIHELNERFGVNLGPEHRVTLDHMLQRLEGDAALGTAARVNTRDNVRLTFDQKVEQVLQDVVDSNFDLYKRITDDKVFGKAVRDYLFDHFLKSHRSAEELIKRGESKTLEFKSSLRWDLRNGQKDDRLVTHAVLKTIAAFLNTDGGDLLIGVADDGEVVGIQVDQLDSDDKFMLHLMQVVRNGLGDRAGTRVDPRIQTVAGRAVCVVSCQRSPEPVYLRWKGLEKSEEGDFFVRSGPGTVRLTPVDIQRYLEDHF